jgi:HEAT repeat protein
MDMGSGAEPAIPDLIELLREKDTEVSGKACMILANIGPASIPEVAQLLASTNETTRAMAAAVFGVMGPQAKSITPDLQRMLAEKSNVIRLAAASALVKIETDPEPLIPVLLDCWRQSGFEGRDAALDALGQLKDRAMSAVPQLTNLLATTKDVGERQMLLGTLQSIDPVTASVLAPASVAEPPESGGQGDRQIAPKQ